LKETAAAHRATREWGIPGFRGYVVVCDVSIAGQAAPMTVKMTGSSAISHGLDDGDER
jgi:hypothetical protein